MKKIPLASIAAIALCYSNCILANNPQYHWTGFYLGANAGYWQSQTDRIASTGASSFVNQTFALGASNITTALAQVATNNSSLNAYGLIGGGQAGYNYESSKNILLGLDINFDGLTNSNNSTFLQRTINLVDFDESYVGSLSIKQKINYLGTVRARLGYLLQPTFLIYATGGFAYGNVTLDTAWTAQESLGPSVFPTVAAQNNLNKTLTGWTAGAGIEWLFKPNWSAMLEYTYYSLNNVNASTILSQLNASYSPSVLWGSATANSALSLSVGAIKLGINYHFS